ncbi:MAG: crotonase/enoyl-CoA hydratase family protein [Candidatus Binatia bacterium]
MPDALVARDGAVLTITLNRPARMNALSGAMLVRMYDAFEDASRSDDIRCIMLTGAGGNFCSGADLRAMAGDAGSEDPEIDVQARMAADPEIHWKALLRSYRPAKPIIAAVEGVAIAGGTEILQATEIRVAGESARFGVSEVGWSLYPMGGSAVRLRRQIPYTHAAEILLTGKHLTAREALAIGLVGHVVPDGQALAKAREIAQVICDSGPLAVEALVRTLHETDGMTEAEALAHEFSYGWAVFQSEDAKEGPRAFKEKRKPSFRRR